LGRSGSALTAPGDGTLLRPEGLSHVEEIKTTEADALLRAADEAIRGNLQAKASAISAPRPDYPYEARSRKITGSGVCVVTVDAASGSVTDATMAQSIGNPILDNAAVSAFRRWRFKPGTVSKVKIPITFTMTGASY